MRTLVEQLLETCGPAEATERARSLLGFEREFGGEAEDESPDAKPSTEAVFPFIRIRILRRKANLFKRVS